MQYLDDIIELIEDIPEEISKRFELIRQWDNDVEKLKSECQYAVKRILELTETSEAMREKILMELADKYRLIHRLSERKLELAVRSERLMSAVLDKVNDSSYLCKIELEVDNPGCTEAIEKNFCRTLRLRPTKTPLGKCNMEFEDDVESTSSLQDQDYYGRCSPSNSRDGVYSSISNGTVSTERVSSCSPRLVSCGSPQNASAPMFKRRKYETNTPQPIPRVLSHARNKEEKFKDSRAIATRREEGRNKQQNATSLSAEPGMASYRENLSGSSRVVLKTEVIDLSEDDAWKEKDALCSEDDFDANDVLDLFPALPSPPREIMESLNEDSLFPDDEHVFDSHPKDYPQSPPMPGILIDSLPSTPSPSASASSRDKKKKTNVTFGNVNETTSLHGRTRKMTERAVKLLQNHKDHEKLKRKVDVVETEVNEQWCFCREGSSGSMICCDNAECKFQWFHFECVGLTVEPKGEWFCFECTKKKR
ncbi:hypothetical protein KIN20_025244 [Parelaphostrongylus tenuis]|uniref:Inhibitor of growth protein n=1 Tax=Parelaphostrongylus tenuis TaxID=148309 RepID=A0AAD5QXR2_PARTN|nr:hypothetical protein KIN20_025244 [Parelaphostrongylus tenuis]